MQLDIHPSQGNLFAFQKQKHPLLLAEIPFESHVSLSSELEAMRSMEELSQFVSTSSSIWDAAVTAEERDWARRWMSSTGSEKDKLIEEAQQLRDKRDGAEGDFLSMETLRKMYSEYLDVERPMTAEEARLIYEKNRQAAIREAILSRGDSGAVGLAAKIGVSLLEAATDPLELTIGLLAAGLVPAVTGLRATTIAGRVTLGAAEGLVGSLAAEGLVYAALQNQQVDYDMNELLWNTMLGTFLGAGISAFSRNIEPDLARTALNQIVNDEPVDFSPFMRDLRSSTSLSRINGVEFQPVSGRRLWDDFVDAPRANVDVDVIPVRAPATTLVMGPDNLPMRYRTVQKADRVATQLGGSVFRTTGGDYVVRQPIEADFVLDRHGDPLVFQTQRSADKFITSAREGMLPDGAVSVPMVRAGEPTMYGVVGNISDKTLQDISTGKASLEIPKGADTGTVQLAEPKPTGDNIHPAIAAAAQRAASPKGDAAYNKIARDYSTAKPKNIAPTAIDVTRTESADSVEVTEALDFYREAAGADAELESQIDAEMSARIEGVKAAIQCAVGGVA